MELYYGMVTGDNTVIYDVIGVTVLIVVADIGFPATNTIHTLRWLTVDASTSYHKSSPVL